VYHLEHNGISNLDEQITITKAQSKNMMCDMCPFGMLVAVAVVQVQRTVHILEPKSQSHDYYIVSRMAMGS